MFSYESRIIETVRENQGQSCFSHHCPFSLLFLCFPGGQLRKVGQKKNKADNSCNVAVNRCGRSFNLGSLSIVFPGRRQTPMQRCVCIHQACPPKQMYAAHCQGQSDQTWEKEKKNLLEVLHLKHQRKPESKLAFNPLSPMQWSAQVWITSHGKHFLSPVTYPKPWNCT